MLKHEFFGVITLDRVTKGDRFAYFAHRLRVLLKATGISNAFFISAQLQVSQLTIIASQPGPVTPKPAAAKRTLEFFTANIRNSNIRAFVCEVTEFGSRRNEHGGRIYPALARIIWQTTMSNFSISYQPIGQRHMAALLAVRRTGSGRGHLMNLTRSVPRPRRPSSSVLFAHPFSLGSVSLGTFSFLRGLRQCGGFLKLWLSEELQLLYTGRVVTRV